MPNIHPISKNCRDYHYYPSFHYVLSVPPETKSMRLFDSIKVTDSTPAYSNPTSETQTYYSLQYPTPSLIKILSDDTTEGIPLNNLKEDFEGTLAEGADATLSYHGSTCRQYFRSITRCSMNMKPMSMHCRIQVIVTLWRGGDATLENWHYEERQRGNDGGVLMMMLMKMEYHCCISMKRGWFIGLFAKEL